MSTYSVVTGRSGPDGHTRREVFPVPSWLGRRLDPRQAPTVRCADALRYQSFSRSLSERSGDNSTAFRNSHLTFHGVDLSVRFSPGWPLDPVVDRLALGLSVLGC